MPHTAGLVAAATTDVALMPHSALVLQRGSSAGPTLGFEGAPLVLCLATQVREQLLGRRALGIGSTAPAASGGVTRTYRRPGPCNLSAACSMRPWFLNPCSGPCPAAQTHPCCHDIDGSKMQQEHSQVIGTKTTCDLQSARRLGTCKTLGASEAPRRQSSPISTTSLSANASVRDRVHPHAAPVGSQPISHLRFH
jgi:hypothetical protein